MSESLSKDKPQERIFAISFTCRTMVASCFCSREAKTLMKKFLNTLVS